LTTNSEILTEDKEPFLQPWQFFLLGGMLAATATVIVATGQSPANIVILSLTVVSVSFVGLGAYRILSPLVSDQPEAPMTIGGRTRVALEREKTPGAPVDQGARVRFRDGQDRKGGLRRDVRHGCAARALGLMRTARCRRRIQGADRERG
jgi:hypothetical protein